MRATRGALPPDLSEAESTNRLRTEAATSASACAGCHDRINPLGLAFEGFDALGVARDTDNGLPVDDTVEVVLDGRSWTVDGGAELGAAIGESGEARGCYALHTVRAATGIDWDPLDPRILPLLDGFRSSDHIPTLIEEIVVSDVFRTLDVVEVSP